MPPLFYNRWDPILAADGGYAVIAVSGASAIGLTIPNGAGACRIQVFGDISNTDSTKAIGFTLDGSAITTGTGQVLGDLDFIELTTAVQLQNFKAIRYESDKINEIRVQYFLA